MHFVDYNACTMKDSTTQITVRGLDSRTKAALTRQAKRRGLSLNKFALESLRQAAGVETSEERYLAMKQFIDEHPISSEDAQAINEAVAWMDKASLEKQKRDERDLSI